MKAIVNNDSDTGQASELEEAHKNQRGRQISQEVCFSRVLAVHASYREAQIVWHAQN